MAGDDTTIKSLKKAIKIIKYIYSKEDKTSVQELCNVLGYNRTTVYHMLKTLENEGFVRKNRSTRNYGAGPELFNISNARKNIASSLFKEAEPIIEDIVNTLNETTCIYVRKNSHALCVTGKESDKRLKASLSIGETIPLHPTATGKILLAFGSAQELETYLAEEGLKRYQKNTITEPAKLKQELTEILRQGYATELEEYEELINAVAVPIKISGQVSAALITMAPVTNLNEQNIAEVAGLLIAKACEISSILNG